ncbi:LLM class flavin-dependent oxidoreductase [Asanoa sp. WMMD1127]|uniref:LLM class flavin-dependent oxidoreductase n=1 Tax=Asanoa sp. WMMD1127 TaxID=3016107 RepID=UPI002417BFB5|nr:LLM class flavin-dependent oxidoreductase [Asanoa sp. WMMD1127]MDG4820772.1 LLM class flavin-dependent oxidoreductase [Asanoa sp. WMMD1127]
MEVGIGLPATVPGVTGEGVVDWAGRAERQGFSSVAVLDRLVYDNLEPVVALAAAAAVTRRIRLATTILIAAYRSDAAVLIKQLATVDRLSGGRLVLGVAAGNRADDYDACGTGFGDRGRRLDRFLAALPDRWRAQAPELSSPPPILVGGHSDAAIQRAARFGTGWIAGGSAAMPYPALADRARAVWAAAGRTDPPRMVSLGYFALGDGAADAARHYINRYYAHAGPYVQKVLASALTDPEAVRRTVAERSAAGCDELVLFPCVADPKQVDLLAEAIG